jgi:hypothetical protein
MAVSPSRRIEQKERRAPLGSNSSALAIRDLVQSHTDKALSHEIRLGNGAFQVAD